MTRVLGQAERAWGSAYFSSFGRRPAVTWNSPKAMCFANMVNVPETIELAQGGPRPEEGGGDRHRVGANVRMDPTIAIS